MTLDEVLRGVEALAAVVAAIAALRASRKAEAAKGAIAAFDAKLDLRLSQVSNQQTTINIAGAAVQQTAAGASLNTDDVSLRSSPALPPVPPESSPAESLEPETDSERANRRE